MQGRSTRSHSQPIRSTSGDMKESSVAHGLDLGPGALIPAQPRVPQLAADDAVAPDVVAVEHLLLVRAQAQLPEARVLPKHPLHLIAPAGKEDEVVVGAVEKVWTPSTKTPTEVAGITWVAILSERDKP